ncbi:Serine/threonine-protein phosphatase 6 regulatory subunit 2 [Tyrophagus putrescentiae]|nr:Serine/threonine-protein phosphatase 6 regulatory subunit 2 [Tyrophagus putrescentiae]
MFWDDQSSAIDALLGQEGVTLETILNEDDVLQECRSPNKALLDFLCKEENLTTMLSVITSEPSETTSEMERFKNANLICEILTYESNPFIDIIVNDDKYMKQLWAFVSIDDSTDSLDVVPKQSTTLNPLLASFFTKVFLHLFTHKLDIVMDFLSRQEPPNDFVSVILRHINASAIMDLMFKTWEYVQLDRKSDKISKYNEILEKNNFIEKLISIFGDKDADLKQTNVANLVSDLVKTGREFLIRFPDNDDRGDEKKESSEVKVDGILLQFEKTEVSQDLLQKMFAAQTKYSIASGLKIIQDLLVYRMQMEQLMRQHQNAHLPSLNGNVKAEEVVQQDVGMEAMPTFLKASSSPSSSECQFMPPQLLSPIDVHGEHLARCVRNVSIALHERLDDFVALLINPSGLAPITTTVGVIELIHLFVALFATSDYSILEKCSQLHILKLLTVSLSPVSSLSFHTTKLTILLFRSLQDLFFEYSHNNQLHKVL